MNDYFRVGVIANTHGIRGEVKVYPTTDNVERFKVLKQVILDTGREKIDLEIQGVKFFKNMAILKFKGIDNINDIEKYKGKDLLVTRENAVELEEDEFYLADVLDAKVVTDEGEELGVIADVLETGANDVFVVETKEGKEVLFPVTKECVLDIDTDEMVVTVHVLPGLLDIN
ncbi:ribosome maturation factor RimM [[Clostridium] polysaccharolyticum]|uniref:Ribosome maturation factor RimM n=1 Tax=[Clostridium] polysaccharolyticum TaxID=29364 RepID=A0A1I0FI39_9FIRM|nr:ribosome maturation factor RimM [[Clostridium] polysaccharolyticum]SET57890.1 16S rRNA processing protein RimM [[Clostridium] polysaccharolyticum]